MTSGRNKLKHSPETTTQGRGIAVDRDVRGHSRSAGASTTAVTTQHGTASFASSQSQRSISGVRSGGEGGVQYAARYPQASSASAIRSSVAPRTNPYQHSGSLSSTSQPFSTETATSAKLQPAYSSYRGSVEGRSQTPALATSRVSGKVERDTRSQQTALPPFPPNEQKLSTSPAVSVVSQTDYPRCHSHSETMPNTTSSIPVPSSKSPSAIALDPTENPHNTTQQSSRSTRRVSWAAEPMEIDSVDNENGVIDTITQRIASVTSLSRLSPFDEGDSDLQPGRERVDITRQTYDHYSPTPPPSYRVVDNPPPLQDSEQTGNNNDVILHTTLQTSSGGGRPNILVFGETGTGKSSLINMIAGRDVATVSGEATGCTFDSIGYNVELNGRAMTFWDTAGLNEGEAGTVPAAQAMGNLQKLVHNLSRQGVHLLVYCIRGTRFREVLRANYEIFHLGICQGIVPIVVVITGLEHEDPMEKWWTENEGELKKQKMSFCGHACVTTSRGKKLRSGGGYMLDDEYAFSQDTVRDLIQKHCSPIPMMMDPTIWMETIAHSISGFYSEAQADADREGQQDTIVLQILGRLLHVFVALGFLSRRAIQFIR